MKDFSLYEIKYVESKSKINKQNNHKMKNMLSSIILLVGLTIISCGPSEAEIKQKQIEIEKAKADSIAQVIELKRLRDERDKAIADSVAQVYEAELKAKESSPSELKKDLITIERENPMRYLDIKYDLDFKLIGMKDVIKGRIINKATLARYKDIELEIKCYSKTKTLIKTLRKTVYEYVQPRSSKNFQYKFKSGKNTKTISVRIIRAKSV